MCKKITTSEFINKARGLHLNKYDYSQVTHTGANNKVEILCKKHGSFKQRARSHLLGSGCLKCYNESKCKKYSLTTDEFIFRGKEKFGNKYGYEFVEYNGYKKYVKIICPIHGMFEQRPYKHLKGNGCLICTREKIANIQRSTKQEFIKKANDVHGNTYNYSNVEYKNNHSKVKIICKQHGQFLQTVSNHLSGRGCPICKGSYGEKVIQQMLVEYKIEFEPQKLFKSCKGKRRHLPFDFYLPKYDLCIEYDGDHHFKPISFFGGIKTFNIIKHNDNIKNVFCKENDIKLVRIPYSRNRNKIKQRLQMVL